MAKRKCSPDSKQGVCVVESFVAKKGQLYDINDMNKITCPKCGKKLDWQSEVSSAETIYYWTCCGKSYTLYIAKLKLDVEKL